MINFYSYKPVIKPVSAKAPGHKAQSVNFGYSNKFVDKSVLNYLEKKILVNAMGIRKIENSNGSIYLQEYLGKGRNGDPTPAWIIERKNNNGKVILKAEILTDTGQILGNSSITEVKQAIEDITVRE